MRQIGVVLFGDPKKPAARWFSLRMRRRDGSEINQSIPAIDGLEAMFRGAVLANHCSCQIVSCEPLEAHFRGIEDHERTEQ